MGWLNKLLGRSYLDDDSDEPSPEAAFGHSLSRALRKAGFQIPIAFDPETFEIQLGDGRTLSLEQYYQDQQAEDANFDTILERIKARLDSESLLPKTLDEAQPGLIPVIREIADLDWAGCDAIDSAEEPGATPRKALNEDLAVAVVWNGADSLHYQTFRGFEAWGIGFEDAYETAMENLKRWPFEGFVEIKPGVMALEDEGGFATSALLRPDLLAGAGITGAPVVMMPTRNTLLLADRGNPEALKNMVAIAAEIIDRSPPLTGFSYVPDGDGWRRFPRPDEDTVEELRELGTEWLAQIYEEQKLAIEIEQQKSLDEDDYDLMEIDWFYGLPVSVHVFEHGGRLCTACPWGKDSKLLLPQTDYVIFVDVKGKGGEGCTVAWEEVRRAFGHLMTPVGLTPERYHVTESPKAKDLRPMEVEFG